MATSTPSRTFEIAGKKVILSQIQEGLWHLRVEVGGEQEESRVWASTLEQASIEVRPEYLDLPLLLVFSEPLTLSPGQELTLYVRIPLRYELRARWPNGKEETLLTLTPRHLQLAWIGPPNVGELAYYFTTEFLPSLDHEPQALDRIYTPLRISNRSTSPKTLERTVLDSYQLSVFEMDGRLVTEVVHILFDGDEVELRYTDEPPAWDAKEVRKGRVSAKEHGLARITKRSLTALIFPRG